LTRGHHFPDGFYGVLAGFVEAGESLEEAVTREIQEEVGLTVTDVRYFGSQPWPFPHQLMIGFTARWAAGEIRVDPQELADAAWFTRDSLPQIPPRMSIARRLIDAFLSTSP
jgi:NAD+ diphosphatase